MARKNRYGTGEKKADRLWRAALYIRLSREDEGKSESDSVKNQRELLSEFARGEPGLEVADIYIDDGFSGTNFDRPEFARMIGDIEKRSINCVIVKDLSRLGRNYIEAGQYIERVFPLGGVRFIAVSDNIDSYKNPQSTNTILVPFKNLLNDEYCRDISNKVRSSLDMKRRQGLFIGSFAPYGYKKSPESRNKLVIDAEAAEVVRFIFERFAAGTPVLSITRLLNESGMPNPTEYKLGQNGADKRHTAGSDGLWSDRTVRRILQKEVYCGDMVQGINRVKSYKLQLLEAVPENERIVVRNTHEPIITRELFAEAQRLFARDTRRAPSKSGLYTLSGFVKCGDCGRAMNRKTVRHEYGEYSYYICSTFKKLKSACTKHSIRCDALEKAVLENLRLQIAKAVDIEALGSIERRRAAELESQRTDKLAAQLRDGIERLQYAADSLYLDWKAGILSKEEYLRLKERTSTELEGAAAKLARLSEKGEAGSSALKSDFVANFITHKNITELDRKVVSGLIENIYVYEGGRIEIDYRFKNPFEEENSESGQPA